MRSYSMDLRQRVLSMSDAGHGSRQVACVLSVSESWVRRVKQRRREFGELGPRPRGGATVIKVDRQCLAELVEAQPDATLAELRERLGVDCALSTICEALKQLRLTFKKSRFTRRNRIGRTSPNDVCNGVSNN